jgi:hypothetical protein
MENKKVSFRIHQIREISFSYFEPNEEITRGVTVENVKYSFDSSFKVNTKKNLFEIELQVVCLVENPQVNGKVAEVMAYRTQNDFVVENLSEFVTIKEDKKFKMNNTLLATLVGIAVSTTRGMIISRTRGSWINQFYVPVINPKDFLEQSLGSLGKNELES